VEVLVLQAIGFPLFFMLFIARSIGTHDEEGYYIQIYIIQNYFKIFYELLFENKLLLFI